jgi:Phage integrase family
VESQALRARARRREGHGPEEGAAPGHDLRHCCASILLNQGVGLETVARILGHRSMASTRRYAHLVMDAKRSAIDMAFAVQEIEPPENNKGLDDESNPLIETVKMVGRDRFELSTNGLKAQFRPTKKRRAA